MLIGLLRPTAGAIEVDGVDVIRTPAPGARPHRLHGAEGQPLSGAVAARERRVLRRPRTASPAPTSSGAGARCASASRSARPRTSSPRTCPPASASAPGWRWHAAPAARALPRRADRRRRRPQPRPLLGADPGGGATPASPSSSPRIFSRRSTTATGRAFIDAGRLIANAAPEELRRRYSDGYRIRRRRCRPAALAARRRRCAPPASRWRHRRRRRRARDRRRSTPRALAALDAAPARARRARCSIEQPPMADVFRRVLARPRRRAHELAAPAHADARARCGRRCATRSRSAFSIAVPLGGAAGLRLHPVDRGARASALGVYDAVADGRQPAAARRPRRQRRRSSRVRTPSRDGHRPRPGRRRDQRRA